MLTFLAFACLLFAIYLGRKSGDTTTLYICTALCLFSTVLFLHSMLNSP